MRRALPLLALAPLLAGCPSAPAPARLSESSAPPPGQSPYRAPAEPVPVTERAPRPAPSIPPVAPPTPPPAMGTSASFPLAEAPPRARPPLPDTPSPLGPGELARFAEGQAAFGLAMLAAAAPGDTNAVLSPASLGIALGMTYLGARGDTAAELRTALHVALDDEAYARAFATVLRSWLGATDGPTIAVASRLFASSGLHLEPAFEELARARFAAGVEPIDRDAPDAARLRVNGWVEERTNGRIHGLLPPGSVTPDTRLVLANALHFKARWADELSPYATVPAPFFVRGGEAASVPTMHTTRTIPYLGVEDLELLELPYAGLGFAMGVVVPRAGAGLADWMRRLDAPRLVALVARLAPTYVHLAMPRFRVAPADPLALARPLRAAGVARVFDRARADLTGIARHAREEDRLYVSEVFHKAMIEVDEQGTEGAAASAVVVARAGAAPGAMPEPKPVIVDRPFFFYVRDVRSNVLLFVGRVVDPRG